MVVRPPDEHYRPVLSTRARNGLKLSVGVSAGSVRGGLAEPAVSPACRRVATTSRGFKAEKTSFHRPPQGYEAVHEHQAIRPGVAERSRGAAVRRGRASPGRSRRRHDDACSAVGDRTRHQRRTPCREPGRVDDRARTWPRAHRSARRQRRGPYTAGRRHTDAAPRPSPDRGLVPGLGCRGTRRPWEGRLV